MTRLRKHPVATALTAIAAVAVIVILGYAVYVANVAGDLPWQTDPTRIPVTPFADVPGFSIPTPLPTAAP
jgi:hypothetical protein